MYLSAAFMQLLRAPDEDSGPCSSLIIQHSSINLPYRSRHIVNTFKQSRSKPLTPSTCNNGRGGREDTGQCLAVPYPDPSFFYAQCQLTVDGHVVDWDFANLSTFLAPVSVNDIKLLSSSNTLPPCSSQKGNPPFPPWFLAFFLLKLFIFQCLGNELHPSSSNPYGTKHTLSFSNNQGGSNKKSRQDDDDDDNDYPYYPDDYGDNEHNDNNDGETPDEERTAKGKEKEEPLYCCAFYKLDPVKYRKCGHLEIKSVAYFLQHIIRQHLLEDKYYCGNCRTGWPKDGRNSDRLWENHTRAGTCQRATLEESGKLLPEEHRQLKKKLKEKPVGSEFDRWYRVWGQLFPKHKKPKTPYLSNEAEEIQASNVRRLNGSLKEELSQMSPGPERDRMEAFARRVIERTFPAYARQGSANAGPSTPRVPPQTTSRARPPTTPPTSTSAPALRPAGPLMNARTPTGQLAPHHRQSPNTSDRRPRSTGFLTNPGPMMNQERISTRPPTNQMMMNPAPAYAMYHGFTNAGLPVDPQRMNTGFRGNPAPTMNSGMMNTAGARYRRIPEQANLGQMNYGTPTNPGNPTSINPSVLTIPGPSNPGPSTNPPLATSPSNFNTTQHHNMTSFQNNNTNGLDLAALESDIDAGVTAYLSSLQNPPDTDDDYPETVQTRFQRI
ncbi:hypothetical protein BHE90_009656 [Fusarium euwallaceae]|uniref:Uncharacterized protein n=1 Tax=Fusarium euwallaceae TaxID=1147111 RepID=A0A430LJP1_9HYPO|nr:hypothetical protein BHE90_009656 [Fusarium euwallaceae]